MERLVSEMTYYVSSGMPNYSLMPGFHHSVLPLPFFRSIAAIAGENGNAGNVFPYT